MVLEDVHWIDPLSQEFLQDLAQSNAELPLCVIVSSRTSGKPAGLNIAIPLKPLSTDEMAKIVAQGGGDGLPAGIARTIVERSEGNPLFAEELRSLFLKQVGVTRREAERGVDRLWRSQIPETIAHITMSRLDRLDARARSLLGIAATIGMHFPLDLLAAVAAVPPTSPGMPWRRTRKPLCNST